MLTNLKKEKYVLDNIDRCNTMVQDIIKSLKDERVKIICQNYYENPSLDKLNGLKCYCTNSKRNWDKNNNV